MEIITTCISLLILLMVMGETPPLGNDISDTKAIEVNGMRMEWRFERSKLICKLMAPSTGWLAVGFNTRVGLKGTNLIMASVHEGKTEISDRFILAAGDHQSISSLGGRSAVSVIEGRETEGHTEITFSVEVDPSDQWHHQLEKEQSIHLLLAFSSADDFQHHSMMRTHLEIKL